MSEKLYPHVMQFYEMFSNVSYVETRKWTNVEEFTIGYNFKRADQPFILTTYTQYKK
jgi:hypothetical protein